MNSRTICCGAYAGSRPGGLAGGREKLAGVLRALTSRESAGDQRSGSGMRSGSPGTRAKRSSRQSCFARSIRASELETKFHQMCRGPSSGAPPATITRESSSARQAAVPAANSISSPSSWPAAGDLDRAFGDVHAALRRRVRQLEHGTRREIRRRVKRRRADRDRRSLAPALARDEPQHATGAADLRQIAAGVMHEGRLAFLRGLRQRDPGLDAVQRRALRARA